MKKHVTKKQKIEKANRKAKREQRRRAEEQPLDDSQLQESVPGAMERLAEAVKPDAPPMSPARRAFQDG